MDKQEAQSLLAEQLAAYRTRPYADPAAMIGQGEYTEVTAPAGQCYQIEIEALWDNEPSGNVRLIGSSDDGGLRAFVPLTESFIMAPNGTFVGEDSV
jgi:hypothetical protein